MPKFEIENVPPWRAEGMLELEEHAPLVRDLETLRKTMTDDVGIVRSFDRLERAKRMLSLLTKEVDLICQETGFLIIKNHGVPNEIIKNLWYCAESFFSFEYEEKFEKEFNYTFKDFENFINEINYKIETKIDEINYLIVPK